jgi:Druantia protein DruA
MKRSFRSLRRELRHEIKALLAVQGFELEKNFVLRQPPTYAKESIRRLHEFSRSVRLDEERKFLAEWFPPLSKYLASGDEVDPCRIDLLPVLVEDREEHSALFRLASLWWSVPVSRGFGRRFRILIFDRQNGKLFGLLGLTDPVFNLRARDCWVGWDVRSRERMLRHVMDAYVLGAVPPYNQLLGAKFVGLLAASDFVRQIFRKRYRNSKSEILGRRFDGRLAMVTTASALGRSSIYNRLRLNEVDVFRLVGRTEGYGHFHLANGTFEKVKMLLELAGDEEAKKYRFGCGPNYRIRVARRALELLGLPPQLLRHGIKRELYAAPLASNAQAFLRGEASKLTWYRRPLNEIVGFWRERWLLPRAKRDVGYQEFDSRSWRNILGLSKGT